MEYGRYLNETVVPFEGLEDIHWVVNQQWDPNKTSLVRKEIWSWIREAFYGLVIADQ